MLLSKAAGGPPYEYRQIDPVKSRMAVSRAAISGSASCSAPTAAWPSWTGPAGTATTANSVVAARTGPELTLSPGRLDPTNPAFNDSRKPLAGEFTFKGDKVFVVANHFNSKGGDQPALRPFQPPDLAAKSNACSKPRWSTTSSAAILTLDPNANVIVLGDLNDFQFSNPVADAGRRHPQRPDQHPAGRGALYLRIRWAIPRTLDHILVGTPPLPVHSRTTSCMSILNSPYRRATTILRSACCVWTRRLRTLTVSVSPDVLWPPNHKYVTVEATVSVKDNADPNASWSLVSVTSNEPDNGLGDGNTVNDIVVVDDTTFQLRAERSGTGNGRIYSFAYEATDACGNTATANTAVYVPHDMGKLKDLQAQFPAAASLPAAMRFFLYPTVNLVQFFYLPIITR